MSLRISTSSTKTGQKSILGHSHTPQISGQFYIGGNGFNGFTSDGPGADVRCDLCTPAFYSRRSPPSEDCPNCAGTGRDPIPLAEVMSGERKVVLK